MEELDRLRAQIDGIDAELLRLFERRMDCAAQIAEEKQRQNLAVFDPEREKAVLERKEQQLSDPALTDYYRDWQRHTMALSRDRQAELLARRQEETPPIVLPGKHCEIHIDRGGLQQLASFFDTKQRGLLVTDEGIPAAYVEAVRDAWPSLTVVTVPQGEGSKSVAVWQSLLETMQKNGFTRDDCVIALGGGMVCDLAGFAAATYLRGVDFYAVPTTLLAMLDASIGGKTALNFGGAKNQIGAFAQPRRVLIDPDTLGTLPRRQLVNGLAEALKMAVCFDPELFARFETQDLIADPAPVIEPCVRHKLHIVMEDERDEGVRRLLNFGHTLGHAIEAKTGLLHGEAVALGMLPMCGDSVRARLLPICRKLGLPTALPCDPDELTELLRRDKKSHAGSVDAVVVEEIGKAELRKLSFDELQNRLALFSQDLWQNRYIMDIY